MAKRPGQKITMTSIDELLCVPDTAEHQSGVGVSCDVL